ncbi:hypothetical protein KY320_01505 [Candidatus Woesearchaeota archaeon]|nr:hypothetical protein [Candidatus Woesearchaeota archaeon]
MVKKMEFEDVIEIAQEQLTQDGEVMAQIVAKFGEKMAVIGLGFQTSEEKNSIRAKIKNMIRSANVEQYWFMSGAWVSKAEKGDRPFVRPTLDINRQEIVVICEFNKGKDDRIAVIEYKRDKNDKIKITNINRFEDKGAADFSFWDAFIDEEIIKEKSQKSIKETNEAYFNKLSKRLAEKYAGEFKAALENKDKEAFDELSKKLMQEIEAEKKRLRQSTLEDTDESEY